MTSVSACSSRPVSRRTSLILCARSLRAELRRGRQRNRGSQRAERRGKNERSAATAMPTCRRTSPASRRASKPPTRTDPASGRSMVEISLSAVVFPLPFGPSSTKTSARRCRERNVFQGNGFAAPLPSKPIEQSWTMAKYLADGFENDSVHESGTRKCERRLVNHETTNRTLRTRAEDSVL